MSDQYEPNSLNAVVSRIEAKLDESLKRHDAQEIVNGKLWAALARIDVRVATIAGGVSVLVAIVRFLWK